MDQERSSFIIIKRLAYKFPQNLLIFSVFQSMKQIVGICLVKNEEHFIAWVLLNAVEFCDKILVIENQSEDRTPIIVKQIASQYNHVELISVKDGNNTHKYVEKYAGTSTWIFRIDGDEVFDPLALQRMRKRLLSGEFDNYWLVAASTLHVLGIDFSESIAYGFSPPGAHELQNLYNFNAIESWEPGRRERLHGHSNIAFRTGYSLNSINSVWKQQNWKTSDFRAMHMCFMPRSPLDGKFSDKDDRWGTRTSVADMRLSRRIKRSISKKYANKLDRKNLRYSKGQVSQLKFENFIRPEIIRQFDPELENVIETVQNVSRSRKNWIHSIKVPDITTTQFN